MSLHPKNYIPESIYKKFVQSKSTQAKKCKRLGRVGKPIYTKSGKLDYIDLTVDSDREDDTILVRVENERLKEELNTARCNLIKSRIEINELKTARDLISRKLVRAKLDLVDAHLNSKKQGIDKGVQSDTVDHIGDKTGCGICFEAKPNSVVWSCSHIFCEECSDSWLRDNISNQVCPVCRQDYYYYTKLTFNF